MPNGAVLIGAMPLIIGIWICQGFGLGAPIGATDDRYEGKRYWRNLVFFVMGIIDFSVLFSILTFYSVFYGDPTELNTYVLDTFTRIDSFDLDAVNRDFAVWIIAIDQALTWILVAAFSFVLSLGVLRWKKVLSPVKVCFC